MTAVRSAPAVWPAAALSPTTYALSAMAMLATLPSGFVAPGAAFASVGCVAGAAGWLALRTNGCVAPLVSWVMIAASAVGLVQLVTRTTVDTMATAAECLLWFALTALFISASSWFAVESERFLFLRLFAAGGGVLAAFTIIQPYAARLGLAAAAAAADTMAGPFRNRNTYAAFVELAFPVAVWAARRFGPEWWLPATALLASSVVTGSRAGAVLALTEAVVLAAWMRNRKFAAVLGIGIALGFFWGGQALSIRLGYHDPFEHRREIYAASLELAAQRPIAGWGLGTFQEVHPAQARFDLGKVVNHAHNDWLEAAVEGGLPFAAMVGGSMVLLLWRARHSVWALGLPVVAVHSLVDFPFQRIGVSVWFFLIAAAAEAHARGLDQSPAFTTAKEAASRQISTLRLKVRPTRAVRSRA